jgi:hypothetical protein
MTILNVYDEDEFNKNLSWFRAFIAVNYLHHTCSMYYI